MLLSLHLTGVAEGGILSGQCAHNITVKASDVRAIACHVASFLALETFITVTGHGVDQWMVVIKVDCSC